MPDLPNFGDLYLGPSYTASARYADGEELINWYSEQIQSGRGRNQFFHAPTPGLDVLTTLSDGPGRGLWAGEGVLFAAAGGSLYQVFQDGTFHRLGDIQIAQTPVRMFANGGQLLVVSGNQAYLADGVEVKPVFSGVMGGYLDGYFILQQQDSKQFNLSAIFP